MSRESCAMWYKGHESVYARSITSAYTCFTMLRQLQCSGYCGKVTALGRIVFFASIVVYMEAASLASFLSLLSISRLTCSLTRVNARYTAELLLVHIPCLAIGYLE